jgi:small subunit ribosomal protein S6
VGVATLNTYEGLFIFADTLKEEELKDVIDRAMAEVTKFDGSVLGVKKLGRRNFARPMDKRESGIYVRTVFNLDPQSITPLLARYKLSEDVFRVQVTRGDSKSLEFVAKVLEEETKKKAEAETAEVSE